MEEPILPAGLSTGGPEVPFLDLYGEAYRADPHAVLRTARESSPYAQTSLGPAFLSYSGVQAVLGDRRFRTPGADLLLFQGITDGPLVDAMRGLLLMSDGEAHDRVRRLVSKTFVARRVEEFRSNVAALATGLAGTLAEELADGGECDFLASFAEPFVRAALCDFVGIPPEAQERVVDWIADISLMFGLSVAQHRERIEGSLEALYALGDEIASARRRAPGPDLVSALVAAGESGDMLSQVELRSMLLTLMAAGQDTSVRQLGHAVAAFLEHPAQWELLVADASLIASAAEETVRFSPASLLGVPRVAKEDVEIEGLCISAGTPVLPVTGSANRDGTVFADADTFDIRVGRRSHLTFGGGMHYCLGATLARIELQEAFRALAAAFPHLRSGGPATWLPPTEAVWGPLTLPIALGSSS